MSRLNPVRFEAEHLDSHQRAILDFIKNSPQCTENQVVKAMDEQRVCSKMTTLRKLDQLIEKQEIKDLLKEGETGFHRFIINENNEFNRITEKLSQIESLLNLIEKMQNLIKEKRLQKHPLDKNTDESQFVFEQAFSHTVNTMLITLLTGTNNLIRSENDAKILYSKNIELLDKLNHIINPLPTYKTLELKIFKEMKTSKLNFDKKIKSKVPISQSEIKHQIESLETEKDILNMQVEISDNLVKTLKDLKTFIEKSF